MNETKSAPEPVHPALYLALFVALVATFGSLYMSDVLGWLPCMWCWYQRILMYPQALLLAVGIARRDSRISGYALLLSVFGIAASLWHIGLQKVPQIMLMYPCKGTVPCSSDSLWQLGWFPYWVTVPMLALTAFAAITICCVAALARRRAPAADAVEGLPPAVFVAAIVLAAATPFAAGAWAARRASAQPAASVAQLNPAAGSSGSTGASALLAADGATQFERSCSGCHREMGETVVYMRPEYVRARSEDELVALVKSGRDAFSADNYSGQAMPAYGGQRALSDAQIVAIVRHVKTLID
jgi:disulfide bond formation protein DsbB